MSKPVDVALWSQTRRKWELWRQSRPVAESSLLDVLLREYPNALVPDGQIELSRRES